jgi:Putative metallopeptidase
VHAGGDEPPVNWRHSSAATLDETAKKARQSFLDRCPGDFIEEFTSGSQTMWPEKETLSLTQFLTKKGRRAITEARRLPCALRGGTICSQPSPVEPALSGERIQITTQHMKSRLLRRRRILFLLAFVAAFASAPAFTQSPPADPASLQAKVDAAALALGNDPRFKRLSLKERQQITEFVAGNMLFVLLHEMAHALTTQMGLPILGKKEDAADSFAITRLITMDSGFADGVLVDAGKGFYLASLRDKKTGDPVPFYDEHGLDEQRGYDVVCLMIGSGQDKYQKLADDTKLPKERQKSCKGDFSDASDSWNMVLKPHLRTPDQPKTKIDVVYGKADGKLDAVAQGLASIMLLEGVADRMADVFVWPSPFTIEIQSCGFPNAQWVLQTHKLTLCYELAADFADLYRDYGRALDKQKRKRKL